MNETKIRQRLRDAVGESRVPPDLRSRIEARLMSSERVIGGSSMFGFGRTGQLVAAVLAILIVGALVIGVRAWHDNLVNSRPATPTVQEKTTPQYQAMVGTDEQNVLNAQSNKCSTLGDGCPAAAARVIAPLQKWLDDLDGTRPPTRFAYVDAGLRRHVAACIKYLNAAVTAYNAQDQNGMDAAISAAVNERDAFEIEVGDIVASGQASVPVYSSVIQSGQSSLLTCGACQSLTKSGHISCAITDLTCANEIAKMMENVEAFQGDLVRDFAPDSLASKDARLQADLWAVDQALVAMQSAWSANDNGTLQTAHDAVTQAFARVETDIAAILS